MPVNRVGTLLTQKEAKWAIKQAVNHITSPTVFNQRQMSYVSQMSTADGIYYLFSIYNLTKVFL